MHHLVAIVPVKDLSGTKQRLGRTLSSEERARLCLAMLADVLTALRAASPTVSEVWVTSPDPAVLRAAEAGGARAVPDRAGSLNGALRDAAAAAAGAGAPAVLLVQGDLPGLTAGEVDGLVQAAPAEGPALVIAPSRDGGTGALYLRPPGVIPLQFGPDSYRRHLEAAAAAGVPAVSVDLPGLSLDLDNPEDLAAFMAMNRAGHTRTLLRTGLS